MLSLFYTLAVAALVCTAQTVSNGSCTFEGLQPSSELTWCPCGSNFYCAKLEVPLDYYDLSAGHASMPLIKYAAATNSSDGAYQGMLVVIPGGPGGSGIDLLRSDASTLSEVIGSNWDLVSYDPRGLARSQPSLDCSLNATSITRRTIPRLMEDYYTSFIDYGRALGTMCKQHSGGSHDAGPHMSTAINVRDLVSLTNAFARTPEGHSAATNSSRLNFYGVSYGTMVGQTFASMFPERVGRAVLDGVVRPETYVRGWTENSITHLDDVLALFFVTCSKSGPAACAYATGGEAQDTFMRFNRSFKQLDARRAIVEHWSNATDITEALLTLKNTAFNASYFPLQTFTGLAKVLVDLEAALRTKNLSKWTQTVTTAEGNPGPSGATGWEFVLGAACSDQNDLYYGQTLQDLLPRIHFLEKQSIMGEIWMRNALGCVGWNIKSRDIYAGPFGGNTATPMLFVSNTFDPVTPIENSRAGAPKYRNAQILTVDALGHTSALTGNRCFYAKVRAYLQHLQLPGHDNFCALEATPFNARVNGTLAANIKHAGLTSLH